MEQGLPRGHPVRSGSCTGSRMIKRSLLIAIGAVILSLLVHGLGLSLTSRNVQTSPGQETIVDVTDVGSTFEDFAEALPEPEAPEITRPEPVVETSPTSQALVASETPQYLTAPDTGTAEVLEPGAAEAPSGGEDDTVSDALAPEAAVTETEAAPPEGAPEGSADPTETAKAAPSPSLELPLAPETLQPDIVIAALPDNPDITETEEADDSSASAITRSLRPPKERPSAEALGVPEGTQQRAASGVIESPLTAYRRSGVDLLSGAGSGGTGASGFRSAGNAGATNYAGQILTRLNRAPVVYASARGVARVAFLINPDGSLAWVRVLRSSGTSDIDRAARAQVRSAAPFPRPPSGTSQRLVFNYRNR